MKRIDYLGLPTIIFFYMVGVAIIIGGLIRKTPPAQELKQVPIVIRLDLTPEAMRACAEAFTRYGFWDVRDYECRVERGPKGVVVALYGPGADGEAGGKKRLGEVPLER